MTDARVSGRIELRAIFERTVLNDNVCISFYENQYFRVIGFDEPSTAR
jgi:ribulose bisphosphate carboxylase small subunit